MDTVYTCVGLRNVKFTGSDGVQVEGVRLYLTYEDDRADGLCTDTVFLAAARLSRLSVAPAVGLHCQLVYNRYGRVIDVVPV